MSAEDWKAVAVIMGLGFVITSWPAWLYLLTRPRKYKRSPWRIL